MKKMYINSYISLKLLPKLLIALLVSIANNHLQASFLELAVIKEAIADMSSSFPAANSPAAAPDDKSCRRAHQGLYNEVVNCIEEQEDQIKVSYNDIIYGFDAKTKEVLKTFWIYKKNLVTLKELAEDLLKTIPSANYAEEPTIVLIYPWKSFSIGTRFKRVLQNDSPNAFAIERIDYNTNSIVFDFVPHQNAIPEIKQDSGLARKFFVKIINDLIDKIDQNNVIPYVWGGSSFVEPYAESNFYKEDGNWHRDGKNNPYSGYDCSEFVMRMAKIAGIDFPWKTTAAIEKSRRALNDQDLLEEGDLIWVQGHVMIVSNLEQNEIIESRGYTSGYGCVHRATLDSCFDGIANYHDLLNRYYNHQTIKFKDKHGIVSEKEYAFKLLKLID